MSEARGERGGDGQKVRRLSDAVRRVRIAEAERVDAFSDLHDAERARLGLLAEELAGVFAEIPETDEYFLCRVAGGTPPRLWVDPTSHVTMARDRRSYRFLKDTRLGRIVIAETADVSAMADIVTDYVAERVVERDRAEETDLLLARMRLAVLPRGAADDRAAATATPSSPARPDPVDAPAAAQAAAAPAVATRADPSGQTGHRGLWLLIAFLFGIAAGAAGLVAYAWFHAPLP